MKNKDSEPNLLFKSMKIRIPNLKGLKLVELKLCFFLYLSLTFTVKIKDSKITRET
jgi:hypothetical protein